MAQEETLSPTKDQERELLKSLLPTDEDLLYEGELLRDPYALKMWARCMHDSGASA